METKIYDIENKVSEKVSEKVEDTAEEVFEKVHGSKLMDQASVKIEELRSKSKEPKQEQEMGPKEDSRKNTQGLDVITNARMSFMDRQKVFAGGWNESSLDLLEALFTECTKKSAAYAEAARASRKKHRMLSIPTLIIASAATATSFFAAGDSCNPDSLDDGEGLKIAVAVLTSVTAVLGGIAALYSFDSKTANCISAAGSFDSLAKETQIQMFLPNDLKGPVEVVINGVSAEACHLTNTSPLL